jgi:hypothetical protein
MGESSVTWITGAASGIFKDPFNDVRGVDAVMRITASTVDHGAPRLTVLDRAVSGDTGVGPSSSSATPAPRGASRR